MAVLEYATSMTFWSTAEVMGPTTYEPASKSARIR